MLDFKLPKLSYEYNALEPYIDAKTMKIHHTGHHQGYVNNLNKALQTQKAPNRLEDILKHISNYPPAVRNNGGGHYNHSLFWNILSPYGEKVPSGSLKEAINNEFGDVEAFKETFSRAAISHFGSGWAWLYVNAQGHLEIGTTPNQDNPLMDLSIRQGTPILGLDLWEHAYYIKYQNKRALYVEAFWQVVDWTAVASYYREAFL